MKQTDWKKAMLNEAEASGNEAWAKETRKASKWQDLERQSLVGLALTMVAASITMNMVLDIYVSTALLSQATALLLSAIFLVGLLIFSVKGTEKSLLVSWAVYTGLSFMFEGHALSAVLRLELHVLMLAALGLAYLMRHSRKAAPQP